jgi:hypothetical protein
MGETVALHLDLLTYRIICSIEVQDQLFLWFTIGDHELLKHYLVVINPTL